MDEEQPAPPSDLDETLSADESPTLEADGSQVRAAPPTELPESTGQYRILGKLGEGGMGVVYMAQDTRLGRPVAIKFLPRWIAAEDQRRDRFRVEAMAAAALNHPNIATIHAIEESDAADFIVMEYVEGSELTERIAAGSLTLDAVMDIACEIAEGLQAAHRKGIVHRDVKPANIMLTPEGRVKIMDFGLAKIGAGQQLTRSGATLGTLSYMSPEQVRGEEVDPRTDIWSFGVVLYEMLTGCRPFKGDYEQAVLSAVLNDRPEPVSTRVGGVPEDVEAVVRRTLEKNRDARYQRMEDVLTDLKAIRTGKDSPRQRVRRPRLAVLPFLGIRNDPEIEFLGFALADQIIGSLSYVEGVLVRPSSAVRKYQQNGVDAPTAGRELQVEFVLTGSYLKDGDVIQLNVELVESRSNEIVWRDSMRCAYSNVFELQDMAAGKVLQGLEIRFSSDEKGRMQADAPSDPLAYEYYLRAVSNPLTLRDNRVAIQMLERSIGLDPSYAPAYAELGFRIDQVANEAMLGIEELRKAEEAFKKALSLNQNQLTALWHLSFHYTNVGRSEEALELIGRMFRVKSDDGMAHFALGYLYRYTGLLEQSVEQVERALELDPRNPRFRSAGFTYVYSGNYQRAYEVFDLDRDGTLGIAWKGMTLFLLGEKERAVEYLDRAAAMEPGGYIGLRHAGISAFIKGNVDAGLRLIRMLERANPSDGDSEHWYLIATAYCLMGDREGCLRTLKKAVDGGFFSYSCMSRDPFLDSVREDPEFRRILELAREKQEAFRERGLRALPGPRRADRTERPSVPLTADPSSTRATLRARPSDCPEVRYCRTADGASIAYAVHGSGPVLVRVLGWFTHLEMEWSWPGLRFIWERLAERHTVVRYDGRGIGLSSAWEDAFTEETRMLDLDAVLSAIDADRVALFGISEGGWTAVHYAGKWPELVSHLVLYGAYSRGARLRPEYDAEETQALETLMRKGWGRDTPQIRQLFTTAYFGQDAEPQLVAHFNELQRVAAPGDTAVRYQQSLHQRGDAREVFARIRTPTLVIHCREDSIVPFEEGRRIASLIPAARFVPFPTMTHYFPLDDDLTRQMADAIDRFTGTAPTASPMSSR